MIRSQINVIVVDYPDRKFLMLRWTDPETGKVRSRSAKTSSRRDAERIAVKLEKELRAGCLPDSISWADFRDRYEREAMAGKSLATVHKYDLAFDHIERILKPVYLADITRESRVDAFIRDMLTTPTAPKSKNGKPGKKRSPETVALYCRHLKSALRWAQRRGLISQVPRFELPRMPKDTTGKRTITTEEYERMVAVCAKQRPADCERWQRMLTGLWHSGLRLGEALQLSWEPGAAVSVRLEADGRAVLCFRPDGHKARRGELTPAVPEFCELLAETPQGERSGLVFPVGVQTVDAASHVISAIGEAAGVVVDSATGRTASAHDFRKSFGTRWSRRVMPAVLQKLMRHKEISTTLKFYVWHDAKAVADELWKGHAQVEVTESVTPAP